MQAACGTSETMQEAVSIGKELKIYIYMINIDMFMINLVKTNVSVFQDFYKDGSEFIFAMLLQKSTDFSDF